MSSPMIRRIGADGEQRTGDLYDTFAALARDEVDHFTALRPHQREIWHMFMVQVATLAIENTGLAEIPRDATEWRRILHALTPQWPDGEPWHMVVDDPNVPALMQPVVDPATFNKQDDTPDRIDVIVAGRNHDVKKSVIDRPQDDDWLFALVTLQTSEGVMGAGTKSVSRINGGYAARMTMRLAPAGGASSSFLRDVSILLRTRRNAPYSGNGPILTWTTQWADDHVSHEALSLDPLYVEVSRRIRLRNVEGVIRAFRAPSPKQGMVRSDRGLCNCPWTPVVLDAKNEDKAFNNSPTPGRRIVETLLDRVHIRRPLLAEVHPEDGPGGTLVIRGLRRDQGATDRFDIYHLPLGPDDPADGVARIERETADAKAAGTGAWNALRIALLSAKQGAPDRVRFDDKPSSEWVDRARPVWEAATNDLASSDDDARRRYADVARTVFADRIGLLPGAGSPRGLVSAARAGGMLDALLARHVRGDTQKSEAEENVE